MNSIAPVSLTAAESCFHCGEAVPRGADFSLPINGENRPMCCPGCRAVASLIADSGLGRFYDRRTAYSPKPEDLEPGDAEAFGIYDDPAVAAQFCSTGADGERDLRLLIGGVTCAACSWLIESTLLSVDGITAASLNLARGRLDVRLSDDRLPLSGVFARIAALGYRVRPWHRSAQQEQAQAEYRRDLRRLAVAGIGMMQVGMFAIALHAGDLQGISDEYQRLLRLFSLLVSAFVVAFSARGFFESAWRHLRHGALVMDLPVALAIAIAFGASTVATVRGGGDVYFDSVVMFTFLLLLARFVEKRLRYRDAMAWQDAEQSLPDAAQVYRDNHWRSLPRREIRRDDRVLVLQGATLPVDGHIISGESAVREDSFSGEALPRVVGPGASVFAGTLNMEASIELRATGSYADTRLAALQRSIETARLEKPALTRLADRIASMFVAAVLLVTTATALVWWQIDASRALWVALSVLVISCPCALSLATPASLASAASLLRRRAILVHGEDALETLADVDCAIFDKTGTLTTGSFSLQEIVTLDPRRERSLVLELANALQAHSNHPIAGAFAGGESRAAISDVSYRVGAGLEGRWQGRKLRMGSLEFCRAIAASLQAPPPRPAYWVALCLEEQPLAWFALGDEEREEAAAVLGALRGQGLDCELLTGDDSDQAREIGARLGFATVATGLSPEGKLARVADLQSRGRAVLMIGDGLNDAPVLKRADVSIAVAGATDLARAQADFVVIDGDLGQVAYLRRVALATRRVIRQNFAWALSYNATGIPLAAMGLVPPWLAVIGMSLSSLLVVGNAARLRRLGPEQGI